jgi:hypothetical protein
MIDDSEMMWKECFSLVDSTPSSYIEGFRFKSRSGNGLFDLGFPWSFSDPPLKSWIVPQTRQRQFPFSSLIINYSLII